MLYENNWGARPKDAIKTLGRRLQRGLSGLTLLLALAALVSCGGGSSDSGGDSAVIVSPSPTPTPTQMAIIVTVLPDFSNAGAHSVINADPPRMARNILLPTGTSDLSVAAQGRFFYRIERFTRDNVAKFACQLPDQVIYQYTTQDPEDTISSNPSTIVLVDEQKGYLLRYGSAKVWIINPAATSEADFKVGELDLSAYNVGNNPPSMQDGVIVNDKLYILLQRLDSAFTPSQTPYVAVFDTGTDIEIDTGRSTEGLKGIPLTIRNPHSIQYLPDNNLIYVEAAGRLGFPAFGIDPEFTGGIENIDPETFNTALVLDDGNENNHPFGQIFRMALVSSTVGYFIGTTDAFADSTLYRFNPTSGEVLSDVNGPIAIGGLTSQNFTTLAVDKNDKLWVGKGDFAAPGMIIVDTSDDSVEAALIGTELNPFKVVFCEIS